MLNKNNEIDDEDFYMEVVFFMVIIVEKLLLSFLSFLELGLFFFLLFDLFSRNILDGVEGDGNEESC